MNVDWAQVLRPNQTVAVYMGLRLLPQFMQQLLEHGADPSMPVAVVEKGTRPDQRVITGTIADIADKVAAAQVESPAMIIIGTVVTLRDKLAWYLPEEGAEEVTQGRFIGSL